MAAFIALFDWIELAGVVVTSDALPTQKVTTATCTGAVSTETVHAITTLGLSPGNARPTRRPRGRSLAHRDQGPPRP